MNNTKILLMIFTSIFLYVGSVSASPIKYDINGEASLESKINISGEMIIDDEYESIDTGYKYTIHNYKIINNSNGRIWEGYGSFVVDHWGANYFRLYYGEGDGVTSDYEWNVRFNDDDDYSKLADSITFWEGYVLTRMLFGEALYTNLGVEWDGSILGQIGDSFSFTATRRTTPAPEPNTLVLLGIGLIGIAGIGRRKR